MREGKIVESELINVIRMRQVQDRKKEESECMVRD